HPLRHARGRIDAAADGSGRRRPRRQALPAHGDPAAGRARRLRVAGELQGLFDTRFGTALMAVASAALAGILTVDIAIAIRQLDHTLRAEHRAREVAESESRVKDDVLALLTGELRTPAGVIHAQAHLLQAGVLTNEKMK